MAALAKAVDPKVAVKRLLRHRSIRWARSQAEHAPARWSLGELSGRLIEISGEGASAALTAAVGLVCQAQHASEPVAWLSGQATFFPPDLAASGIALDRLAVVVLRDNASLLRAADRLLRAAAFGLLILDFAALAEPQVEMSLAVQTRLAGLAKTVDCAVLCLTHRPADCDSLGSLISLRAVARRRRLSEGSTADSPRFVCELQVLKDKRHAPGWMHRELCCAPTGLR